LGKRRHHRIEGKTPTSSGSVPKERANDLVRTSSIPLPPERTERLNRLFLTGETAVGHCITRRGRGVHIFFERGSSEKEKQQRIRKGTTFARQRRRKEMNDSGYDFKEKFYLPSGAD